jgi:tetratricopeptide (TPR) repeat protein
MYRLFLLLVLSCVAVRTNGQKSIRFDEGIGNKVLAIADPLYNLEFQKTDSLITELSKEIPNHPIVDLLFALNRLWASLPNPQPDNFPQIETFLRKSINKADAMIKLDKRDPEAIFFRLMSHGLLAQYYSEQGSFFKAVSEAKSAYNAVIAGFKLKEEYVEFYFSCGLYNYYRERYPQLYPAYRPLVWIFRKGNIENGLGQLQYTMNNAVLARVEAAHYLAYIYLRYENDPESARILLQELIEQYPNNLYFKSLMVETLISMNDISPGTEYIEDLLSSERTFFHMYGYTFKGIYNERMAGDLPGAEEAYNQALKISEEFKGLEINAVGMAYAGLGRVYDQRKDVDQAKYYYKKASSVAVTRQVKRESREYLKSH